MTPARVLFVCTGNICRSPLAEGVLDHLASDPAGETVRVDSAGTGRWHIGDLPDHRARAVALRHGIELTSRARQLDPAADFLPSADGGFDYLVALDLDHHRRMLALGAPTDRVHLLRSFDPALAGSEEWALEVPDPYYGPDSGFDECYDMVHAACVGLLDHIRSR